MDGHPPSRALTASAIGDVLRRARIGISWRPSWRGALGLALLLLSLCVIVPAVYLWVPAGHQLDLRSVLAGGSVLFLLGLVVWWRMRRATQRALHAAAGREERFRAMLRMSADWYWEQDEHFRFTHIADPEQRSARILPGFKVGSTPWDLEGAGLTEAELDAHLADLDARRPFRGTIAAHRDENGLWRYASLSGEPRFDAHGVFQGYWGVGRDVTRRVLSQRAVEASENRWRELFERSPSPLLVHRAGLVRDANAASARLFGFLDATAMRGYPVAELYAEGDSRQRQIERIARLERLPVGRGVPVDDFQLAALNGRSITAQATAVRIDTDEGPANLSIYFDVTARVAAENALRQSENMLSSLFATSPDGITLTDLDSGRFVMVNESFTRLLGYSQEELVGRVAGEIKLWQDPAEGERFAAAVRRNAQVNGVPALWKARSGRALSMSVSGARFSLNGRDYIVASSRDVTEAERLRIEHAAVIRNATVGIALTQDRRFQLVNPRFEAMFGWPESGLVGQDASVVWPRAADYEDMGRSAGPVLAAGQPLEIERVLRRHDGSEFWCRVLAQAVDPSDPARGGTIWIVEDVTERRQVDQALATARDAAEAANRAKSAFLANTSHEIRTPLNGLLGMASLAMQPGIAPALQQQYLKQIHDSAQGLAAILSDILDLSKIEAGKIALESVDFNLHDALRAAHASYQSLAEAKGLTLRLALQDGLPLRVHGDPVRLRQILGNFVSNALKFTERGAVQIRAERVGGVRLRVSVSDTGPGIAPEVQQRLFLPFTQADESTTRRYGGTGLGLSICRELARLMAGEVGVDSVPGRGSVFWVELPWPAALPAAASAPGPYAAADTDPAKPVATLTGKRVLMVEDNPVNMMIGVAMLEQWGIQVTEAVDGASAIEAVQEAHDTGHGFDAVLMDVQMPDMSGHETAQRLRQRFDSQTLPIIALTAAALVSERDSAMASGMDEFLTKPVDATRLRDTLLAHVSARPRQPHQRSA